MIQPIFILLSFALLVQGATQPNSRIIVIDTVAGSDTPNCLWSGNVACNSLTYALTHLQNNSYVNITSNLVSLTSPIELHHLNAITIRGQGNTIVMCNSVGGVSCNHCSNVVIEGITWDRCGNPQRQNGAIHFCVISNLVIQNCTIQHSQVRALSLFALSGFVYVTNSDFVSNANYDTIFCYSYATHVYKFCGTADYAATGGMLIRNNATSTSDIDIHIENCTFNNNGYMGDVEDDTPVSKETRQLHFGAGLSILLISTNVLVDVSIKYTTFSFNHGASGAAAHIHVKGVNPIIKLTGLQFWNNSVIKLYHNASALTLCLESFNKIIFARQSMLNMSSCIFYGNHGGRNMVSYVVAGEPSQVLIDQCNFSNNWDYNAGLVELYVQSQSTLSICNANFSQNTRRAAILYLHMHSSKIKISMFNLNIERNFGSSVHKRGGMILITTFNDNNIISLSKLNFTNNYFSSNGGGIYILGTYHKTCQIFIQDSHFNSNTGFGPGTVIYTSLTCVCITAYIISIENCFFTCNTGKSIVYVGMEHYVLPSFLVLNSEFLNNTGTPLELFNVILVGNGTSKFHYNKANVGGAIYLSNSYIFLNFSSFQLDIRNNFANAYAGGIFVDFSLSNVNRSQCHWLLYYYDNFCSNKCTMYIYTNLFCEIFLQTRQVTSNVYITNNTALLAGSALFYNNIQSVAPSRRSTDILDSVSIFSIAKSFTITPNITEPLVLATQPRWLQLTGPAECNDDYTACNVTGITLGEDIEIPAKIMGYNEKPSEATRFFIECTENCIEFSITGGPIVLVINKVSGISIVGKKVKQSALQLVSLKIYGGIINVILQVEILPCQLGYTYNRTTKQCHCYTVGNIVSCAANTTIRKGHWFGMIGEEATVSLCPNKYCNFSRTEINSGKYILQSFYDDQCGRHRTGQACGSCSNGYTLAFDFHNCVNIHKCSPGITSVIVVCVILYWILIVAVTLWLMYFQINVGYLYGIIYYYSIVDVLLGQIINYSGGFDIIEIIISSIVKLSPRFLSKLCFLQGGMSGIDQYALHYIHPTGILFILVILSVIARRSQRFALFISRGAIRAICFILILAYTSIADTSLQLFRPLKFTDTTELYTYLSPDVRYFSGRHVIYVIIAVLFELVIVVGLPIVLLFEPYINRWINFARIKPILDQFQGCYRDKYRWFAAVYLLSRQAILVVMMINFINYYITLYLLTTLCLIIALLHYHFQPYKSAILNWFDGFILLLLVLVVTLQMVAVCELNGFTSATIIGLSYALYFVPVVACIVALVYYCVHISRVDLYRLL